MEYKPVDWKQVPKDLDEAVERLKKDNADTAEHKMELEEWCSFPEKKATATIHMFSGMGIRNGWGLWLGSPLAIWFYENYGIAHADDMSGIIFTCLHRECNGVDWDVKGQACHYIDHWEKAGEQPTPPWLYPHVGGVYEGNFTGGTKAKVITLDEQNVGYATEHGGTIRVSIESFVDHCKAYIGYDETKKDGYEPDEQDDTAEEKYPSLEEQVITFVQGRLEHLMSHKDTADTNEVCALARLLYGDNMMHLVHIKPMVIDPRNDFQRAMDDA